MMRVQNPIAAAFRMPILGIDWMLRRYYRVEPYSHHPDCILRLGPGRSDVEIMLSDSTVVRVGDPVVRIHLWSERLRDLPSVEDSLGWGRLLVDRIQASLRLLESYLNHRTAEGGEVALCGEYGFVTDVRAARAMLQRMGFDFVVHDHPRGRFWRRSFWDNFYSYLLMWTFNPRNLRGKRMGDLIRIRFWMSRQKLKARYGSRE